LGSVETVRLVVNKQHILHCEIPSWIVVVVE
jgi:hypothetical protein